jgi:2-polyprenyl-3-methyl-5-hydroxy-6-metoxy-1,4-benzoquinol methylase
LTSLFPDTPEGALTVEAHASSFYGSPDAALLEDLPRSAYDYEAIPDGHYDRVLREGNPIRRLWHLSKFERVLDQLPSRTGQSLLDIGCFAGSFLSLADSERFSEQRGVDVLPAQIDYANTRYGTSYRSFHYLKSITALSNIDAQFDCMTLIEVIEHLSPGEIRVLFSHMARMLKPGGKLILTTPNYASTWPVLEQILNRIGDVNYEEQHITRLNYFNLETRLAKIYTPLHDQFEIALKTTTHFVTPFLAGLSFNLAWKLSRLVPSAKWRMPFGNLVLVSLTRRG